MRTFRSGHGSGGFALVVVVFLLFAVGVSAAATYQLIRAEVELSSSGSDFDRARAAAEAGARIVIGNAVRGAPNDTVFTIDDGSDFPPEVQVTARRQADVLDWEDLYLITALGRVTDPRNFDYPAIREVKVFARLRNPPMAMDGGPEPIALLIGTGNIDINSATVSGNDVGTCSPMPPGASNVDDSDEAFLSQIGLPDFSVLTSPSYPVDNNWSGGAWPFAGIPVAQLGYPTTTDYPVTRVSGATFSADSGESGFGVLLVAGNLVASASWVWNGIVLIGGYFDTPGGADNIQFRGVMVAGLSGGADMDVDQGTYRYDSCHFYYAGRAIGAMNPEPLTWWSGY